MLTSVDVAATSHICFDQVQQSGQWLLQIRPGSNPASEHGDEVRHTYS
jgi:hypothetical protein